MHGRAVGPEKHPSVRSCSAVSSRMLRQAMKRIQATAMETGLRGLSNARNVDVSIHFWGLDRLSNGVNRYSDGVLFKDHFLGYIQSIAQEMESSRNSNRKPHVICIPSPFQSHIKAMLKLAKLLHNKGIAITFVNTEFNHKRFLKKGAGALNGLPDFEFVTIPDGLPPSDPDATQDFGLLCEAIKNDLLGPFRDLLSKINGGDSPVSFIVSDGFMKFSLDAGEEFGIPVLLSWTISACAFMGFYQFRNLLDKGYTPLKDASYLTNGYLDTIIDWIPGMKNIRLKDLPSFFQTTDPNELAFNFSMECTLAAHRGTSNIFHTYDDLEPNLVKALSSMLPNVYTIGPQQLLLNNISLPHEEYLASIDYSLWKEEPLCLKWLDSKKPYSVIYVNFGSITVMSPQQLMEFGWGLANSNHFFLWVIRPDLVIGETSILPPEFVEVIKERGCIASWCPQEQVLNHHAIGGFLTHCGWNSTIESLSAGVPMICWPFFGDQTTNCKYTCCEWECGMEMESDAKREKVEEVVRQVMEGEKGKSMRMKANEWKRLAEKASDRDGSSSLNLDKLVVQIFG